MNRTEERILNILGCSHTHEIDGVATLSPVKQLHLWLHIRHMNIFHEESPIEWETFIQTLHRLKRKGKVKQTYKGMPGGLSAWALAE